MALADLIARLERDAQGQVEAIAQRAEEEVRAIEAETARGLAEATAQALAARRAELQATLQAELGQARRRSRADHLAARHALVVRILTRARALIDEAAATARYRDALPAHFESALSYLEGLDVRVRCAAATEPLLRPLAAQRGVALQVDPTLGPGFVAETRDGSVTIDNTLAARLGRIEPRLAIDLLAEVDRGRG